MKLKLPTQTGLIMIIGTVMVGLASAENDSNDVQSVVSGVTDADKVQEVKNASDGTIEKSQKTNEVTQKGRSIKMIIGGQSEDGMAKQVTVPVKD